MNAPSPWLLRWAPNLRPGATALDLACGSGRHLRWLAERGLRVTGVDRDGQALASLQDLGARCEFIEADIEAGPWPLDGREFDLVLVTNYLWRPVLTRVISSLAPGGWLVYETFADGQQSIGRPARADFLLQAGELLRVCEGLRVIAFEDGFEAGTTPRYVQRIAAVRTDSNSDTHPTYLLSRAE